MWFINSVLEYMYQCERLLCFDELLVRDMKSSSMKITRTVDVCGKSCCFFHECMLVAYSECSKYNALIKIDDPRRRPFRSVVALSGKSIL